MMNNYKICLLGFLEKNAGIPIRSVEAFYKENKVKDMGDLACIPLAFRFNKGAEICQ